jgi:hypothetical protein
LWRIRRSCAQLIRHTASRLATLSAEISLAAADHPAREDRREGVPIESASPRAARRVVRIVLARSIERTAAAVLPVCGVVP